MEGEGQGQTGDPGTQGGGSTTSTPPAPAAPAGNTGIPQERVDQLVGQARQEGRSSAEKALLESLGVENIDAAKAKITAANEAESARLTEAERLTRERDEAKAQAIAAEERAKKTLLLSSVTVQLQAAGIKPERVEAALRMVDLSAVTVEGEEVRGAKEAAEKLLADFPEWKGATPLATTGAPNANAGGPPAGGDRDFRSASAEDVARELREYAIH